MAEENTGAEVQGDQPQGQQAANADAVQPDQGQGVSGPWAEQLNSRFADQATRAQVDEFLKAEIQPYVTRLEQARSDVPEEAGMLYNDFRENPDETYLAITQELYGPEAAQAVRDALDQGASPEEAAAVGQQVGEEQEEYEEDDPVMERMRQEYVERLQLEQYNSELERMKEGLPESERKQIKDSLFAPFVVSANGDFDVALEGYKEFLKEAKAEFGLSPDEIPEPPATIGSDVATGTAPPTQKKYESIDDALDDTLAEMRAQKAPATVGVV